MKIRHVKNTHCCTPTLLARGTWNRNYLTELDRAAPADRAKTKTIKQKERKKENRERREREEGCARLKIRSAACRGVAECSRNCVLLRPTTEVTAARVTPQARVNRTFFLPQPTEWHRPPIESESTLHAVAPLWRCRRIMNTCPMSRACDA